MNKERELLALILSYAGNKYLTVDEFEMMAQIEETFKEISELLAKPEEEGVYQKILRIEDGIEVEILPSELWLDGYETGRKDPQKRESIDDGELEVWYSQHTWAMDKQEYMWGFKDAEKAHGIGGGE